MAHTVEIKEIINGVQIKETFFGDIKEFSIWHREFSETEIQLLNQRTPQILG